MTEIKLANPFLMQGLTNFYITIDGMQYAVEDNFVIPHQANMVNPRIEIYEEPTSKFRFRYESEAGCHGSLMGVNSTRANRCFPKIKICDYTGKIKIKGRLYAMNDGIEIPHVHKLEGKFCTEDGIYEREHTVTGDTIIDLEHINIKHIAKKKVRETLLEQYVKELSDSPATRFDSLEMCRKQADVDGKILEHKLNEVKIGIEADFYLDNQNIYLPLGRVFTQSIMNSKGTHTGDLQITQMSLCSGTVEGGDSVIILCEKVDKKNIEVRFNQMENGEKIWEAKGIFNESDVHHQYAIMFKTPPYKDQNIQDDVDVNVILYRRTDKCESEPRTWTYKVSEGGHIRKKAKMMSQSAAPTGNYSSTGPGSAYDTRRKNNGRLRLNVKGGNQVRANEASCSKDYVPTTAQVVEDMSKYLPQDMTYSATPLDLIEKELSNCNDLLKVALLASNIDPSSSQEIASNSSFSQSSISQTSISQTSSSQEAPIQPNSSYPGFDYLLEEENNYALISLNDPMLSGNSQRDQRDVSDYPMNESPENSFASAFMNSRGSNEFNEEEEENELNDLVVDGKAESTKVKRADKKDLRLSYRLAVSVANSLLQYARTNEVESLLKSMGHLIAYSDDNGDNPLHLAIIHSNHNALRALLKTLRTLNFEKQRDVINDLNKLYQTPLHIAVCHNECEFVRLLLEFDCGIDPYTRDRRGNTAFHAAVENKRDDILRILLQPKERKLQLVNNSGYTALHLAVIANSLPCIKLLLDAGANIDCRDRTSGRTPLHIAVEYGYMDVVCYLLDKKADVDIKMFNGRTPLHVAVLIQSEDMVGELMAAYADPYTESDECPPSLDSSDEDGSTDEVNPVIQPETNVAEPLNCFDMAKDNENILALLHGTTTYTRKSTYFIEEEEKYTGPDSGVGSYHAKNEPGEDSGALIPKSEYHSSVTNRLTDKITKVVDEKLTEKLIQKHPDEDSGMCLFADDYNDDNYLKKYEGVDSGLGLSKNECVIVDAETSQALSKLLDPPGEKNWEGLVACVGLDLCLVDKLKGSSSPTKSLLEQVNNLEDLLYGLEVLGSEEGLNIVRKYSKKKDMGIKQIDITARMKKLDI